MLPELFTIFGITVQSYGVSKAFAILVAGLVLARAFRRHNLSGDAAWSLVIHTTIWGFVGAKLYFLAEHADAFSWHHRRTRGHPPSAATARPDQLLSFKPEYVSTLSAPQHHGLLPVGVGGELTVSGLPGRAENGTDRLPRVTGRASLGDRVL